MPLQVQITLLVLLSAFLHAVWNAVVKVRADRTLTLGLVSLLAALVSLAMLPFVAFPPPQAWKWILAAVAGHLGFKIFLLSAYRTGDFSQVYPLARGSAPLLVALGSGEFLGAGQRWGVALISAGIFSLTFDKGIPRGRHLPPVLYALITGAFIAGYTVADGNGVRLVGSTFGYAPWLFVIDGTLFAGGVLYLRRGTLRTHFGPQLLTPLAAGAISLVGYFIIIWAVSRGAMAPVAALRETGVIFAALIGTLLLKEPFGLRRIAAAASVVAGIAAMSLA
jgi:drug/metabolite transporter (DMT)-like permease